MTKFNEDFEQEKLCFQHNSEQIRHLNSQMNSVPITSMILTGGLWYAAGSMNEISCELKFYILIFASFCNVCLALICFRIRDVLESYLEKVEQFRVESYADGKPAIPILGSFSESNSMIIKYTLLIVVAAFLSLIIACTYYWPYSLNAWLGGILILVVFSLITYIYHQIVRRLEDCHRKKIINSIKKYYDHNATCYFAATKDIDMQSLHKKFLKHVKKDGKILDAGSGAGRDTKAFLSKGYSVTAFDISSELAKISSKHTEIETKVMGFEGINELHIYDGIWASASLLHLPIKTLEVALSKMAKAINNDGVIYVSFKHGNTQRRTLDGRYFTDMNEAKLRSVINQVGTLRILEAWVSEGEGKYKGQGKWFNAILVKL